jgi:hypothetical protein
MSDDLGTEGGSMDAPVDPPVDGHADGHADGHEDGHAERDERRPDDRRPDDRRAEDRRPEDRRRDERGEAHGGYGEERPEDDTEPRSDEEEDEAERAVTAVTSGIGPLRPPRRTGIFVDAEDLRDHVGHLLRSILGGYEVDAFGNFTFTHEDARVFVTVGGSPIGPTVGVFSVTNLEIDLTPALAAFLLATNHTLGFGAFSYDPPNRAVWLRYTLLGTTLDGPELQSAVAAVATTAARLDDHIRDRFGGRTFQEVPGEVQRRMEPPSTPQDPQAPPGATGYL